MINIFYVDDEIVVCDKPRGILSQEGPTDLNMISILSEQLGTEVMPVHRLDKTTGGIMVYALTKRSAAILSNQILNHTFEKQYVAIVHGKPKDEKGIMTDYLFRDVKRNKTYVVDRIRKGVRKAELQYEAIKSFAINDETFTCVRVKLLTGRTHQIRAQFSYRKMPLVGDKRYGAKDTYKQIELWSNSVKFCHPITNNNMIFSSQPKFNIKLP